MSILYVHGFASCGRGAKARVLLQAFGADKVLAPDLPVSPRRAVAALEERIGPRRDLLLIGSSLGGYYATWLAHHHRLPAVLINPSVRPFETLAPYVGPVHSWCTGKDFQWREEHVRELRDYRCAGLSPQDRFLVLLQTGDEVLDYRAAADHYRDFELVVEEGGSHGFDGFEQQLGRIRSFHERQIGPL